MPFLSVYGEGQEGEVFPEIRERGKSLPLLFPR
jgi:hypothetical protein